MYSKKFKNKKVTVVYKKDSKRKSVYGFVSEDNDNIYIETPWNFIPISKKNIVSIMLKTEDKTERETKNSFKDNFSYREWWKDNNVKEAE